MPPEMDDMDGGRSPFDSMRVKPKRTGTGTSGGGRFSLTRWTRRLPLPLRILFWAAIIYLSFVGITQTWNTVIPHYEHCDMCFSVIDKWYTVRITEGWNPVSVLMGQEETIGTGKYASYTLCEDCFTVWESSFRYYRLHDGERRAVLGG